MLPGRVASARRGTRSRSPAAGSRRKDNLYEFGGGLVWEFVKTWSLRPEILYIRDQSNAVGFNYSSTEVWINIRKAL